MGDFREYSVGLSVLLSFLIFGLATWFILVGFVLLLITNPVIGPALLVGLFGGWAYKGFPIPPRFRRR